MVGSMLGLAPFILAFTFWIAATHFDAARQAKLNEANGIRAAYLRADLLPEPQRAEIGDLLREYVDVRLEAIRSWNIKQAISRSEELHSRLRSQAVAAREKTSSPIFAGYFIQPLTALATASIGCHAGLTGASRPLVVAAFVLIISAVMLSIADIDSPRRVALGVSQQVLVDLRRAMSEPYHCSAWEFANPPRLNVNERGASGVAFCALCGFLGSVVAFHHRKYFWKGLLEECQFD
jgi:hypothetical protein